jgi:hypothetical protein
LTNWPIGNKNKRVRMRILGILHDFIIFFIGKGTFYQTLRKTRKIPALIFMKIYNEQ